MDMFYIFIGVVVSQVGRSVKTHQIGHFRWIWSIEYKLCFNNYDFQKLLQVF